MSVNKSSHLRRVRQLFHSGRHTNEVGVFFFGKGGPNTKKQRFPAPPRT
jgi:hypothetical protein